MRRALSTLKSILLALALARKYYTGTGIVTSKSITASFDGMVEASFAIQVNGAVTEATA